MTNIGEQVVNPLWGFREQHMGEQVVTEECHQAIFLDISRGFVRVVQRCPFCVGMMLSARSEINMGCAWLLAGLNC